MGDQANVRYHQVPIIWNPSSNTTGRSTPDVHDSSSKCQILGKPSSNKTCTNTLGVFYVYFMGVSVKQVGKLIFKICKNQCSGAEPL